MSDSLERFEEELLALRPRAVSAQTRRKISRRLEARGLRLSDRARAAVLVAACFCLGLLARRLTMPPARTGDVPAAGRVAARRETLLPAPTERNRPTLSAAFDDAPTTLWDYRCALGRSTAEFDDLLTRPVFVELPFPDEPLLAMGRLHHHDHALDGKDDPR